MSDGKIATKWDLSLVDTAFLVAELEKRREVTGGTDPVPQWHFDLYGLTDDTPGEATTVVQFATWDGNHHTVYGDQTYVAYGDVLRDRPGDKLRRRTVTIHYGPWIEHRIGRDDEWKVTG